MPAKEDLIGWGEGADPVGSGPDLGHAVKAGPENHETCGGDGPHHEGATSALEAVEAEQGQLAERGVEEEHPHHGHLHQQQREQQLDHRGLLYHNTTMTYRETIRTSFELDDGEVFNLATIDGFKPCRQKNYVFYYCFNRVLYFYHFKYNYFEIHFEI